MQHIQLNPVGALWLFVVQGEASPSGTGEGCLAGGTSRAAGHELNESSICLVGHPCVRPHRPQPAILVGDLMRLWPRGIAMLICCVLPVACPAACNVTIRLACCRLHGSCLHCANLFRVHNVMYSATCSSYSMTGISGKVVTK